MTSELVKICADLISSLILKPMSSFGLIDESIELSHIHLAVHTESFK